ncbi:UDP-galactopyranose mutase [Sphingomonas sp. Leaf357]|uniref:UDP-galactopyranose mutase n=1 Tax=Sphingomonas sp. Leaf357 TaxID=1736350 RepID=UPI001F02DFC6|nr:UDP-galactopyranose mutase [Sphingomonas sp. Leaf357]
MQIGLPTILSDASPLICFSHLRWDFVIQRPQHLMRRSARERRVYVWEEPIPCDHPLPYLEYHPFPDDNVIALRPRVPRGWSAAERETGLKALLDMFVATSISAPPILWFYTPMMFAFAGHVDAAAIVYDCMDELSAFKFADPALLAREAALIGRADVMFTGGQSLFEAKKSRHGNIRAFPSAVDVPHFAAARETIAEPVEQARITAPILGFYGVIDERIDLDLIDAIAAARPDWSLVMVGPVVKIAPDSLPRRANVHWVGGRDYADLPAWLSGWNVALMPFAINEATRYISPTKTPEYLAAGCPVVSTPIVDVVAQYGGLEGVGIAANAAAFVSECERVLALPADGRWRDEADALLATMSWDRTYDGMHRMVLAAVEAKRHPVAPANDLVTAPAIRPSEARPDYDVLVVGAGFAGSVLAERLAAGSGKRVLLIDRRDHLGGNAYDEHDAAGILVHRYGPHIFHTNSDEIVRYLSDFTRWRPYEHRVLASVRDKLLPIPINRTTLNGLYGLDLSDDAQAAAFLAARAEPREIRTSEDVVIAAVGQELYETFFRGYTRKQWGLDPSELDKSVTARVPTRTSTDDRYFLDTFQAMPADGYTRMFENMIDHDLIDVELGVDFRDVRGRITAGHTIFTGPVDEYFDHRFGALPYRCLDFRHETHDMAQFQPVAVVNYPSEDIAHTRITEYKHLTGQAHARTSISYEYSSATGNPYYPIPRADNQAVYKQYEALADALLDVSFVGRLATYKYYNMDQVVGQALATYRRLAPMLMPNNVAVSIS